jgi:hypothetical protein
MSTSYTGSPTAVQAPASAPAAGVAPILSLIQDADGNSAANLYQAWKVCADYIAYLMTRGTNAAFGDGSDGDVVVSTPTTLTRDTFYNNLTVSAGGILNPSGFRIYVNNTLTTSGGGKIQFTTNTGGAGPSGTGGAAVADGSIAGSLVGGANATNGTASTNAYGGTGGGGGTGTGVPGSGGVVTAPAATLGSIRTLSVLGHLVGGATVALARGGAGGGGGSGASGGGGGAGGGVIAIAARVLNLASASDIIAPGGIGGPGATNSGGGGGGGGGLIQLVYSSKNAVTFTAAANCPGGVGGAGAGTGVTGATGSNGTVVQIQL